jgi:hypothetical protein
MSSSGTMATMLMAKKKILLDMEKFKIEMVGNTQSFLSSLVVKLTLLDQIKVLKVEDLSIIKIVDEVRAGKKSDFNIAEDGVL